MNAVNNNFGPLQGGVLLFVLGGTLLALISNDSPKDKLRGNKVPEEVTEVDWSGFYDFLDFMFTAGLIALGIWLIYKAYAWFAIAIWNPIRLSHERIDLLEKELKSTAKSLGDETWHLRQRLSDAGERLEKQKKFILGMSKFSGYEGYLASLKAMQEMTGEKGGHHE